MKKLNKNIAFYISIFALLIINGACDRESKLYKNGEVNMKEICEFPEDKSVFESNILENFNGEITASDIEKLQELFDSKKEKITNDAVYSKKEKIKAIFLEKTCKSNDGVDYKFSMGAIVTFEGELIFSQFYLTYKFEDIFSHKRKYKFGNFMGSQSEHSKLISQEVVGLMNFPNFDAYIKELGAELIDNRMEKDSYVVYVFNVDPKNDMASRLAGYDFSKKIQVYFDENHIANKVKLTW